VSVRSSFCSLVIPSIDARPASVTWGHSQRLRYIRFVSPLRCFIPASVIVRLSSHSVFQLGQGFRCSRPASLDFGHAEIEFLKMGQALSCFRSASVTLVPRKFTPITSHVRALGIQINPASQLLIAAKPPRLLPTPPIADLLSPILAVHFEAP